VPGPIAARHYAGARIKQRYEAIRVSNAQRVVEAARDTEPVIAGWLSLEVSFGATFIGKPHQPDLVVSVSHLLSMPPLMTLMSEWFRLITGL
jgi:hypothetical protein